jgi:hypothetical protein
MTDEEMKKAGITPLILASPSKKLNTACHNIPFQEGFDMKDKSKPWICSIYYYLKCGMETEKRKNEISGRNMWYNTPSTVHRAGGGYGLIVWIQTSRT